MRRLAMTALRIARKLMVPPTVITLFFGNPFRLLRL